ncbi:MAG: pantetheine-phosphate adenylyltransferase [Clostridiales Family XIII bacterium]|jgi:pantetheine-phosphate adenylyltransferase|nr:pantetheine-phosphate adenylyltransferase [Clostridiales Family XIII bacterium]
MKKNVFLYAGTFDPITNGHLDVIRRAAKLADTLLVAVLVNSEKRPRFSAEDRLGMIRLATAGVENVEIVEFSGLLADYVNAHGVTAVVRGLRTSMDFDYEIPIAQMSAHLYETAETIFFMAEPAYSFISSTIVKEVLRYDGDIRAFVPEAVHAYLRKLVDEEKQKL